MPYNIPLLVSSFNIQSLGPTKMGWPEFVSTAKINDLIKRNLLNLNNRKNFFNNNKKN